MKSKAGSLSGLTKLINPLQDISRTDKRYKPSISERIALQVPSEKSEREERKNITNNYMPINLTS